MSEWYDNFDDNGKRPLEKAIVKYLNVYNKVLIEIMSEIQKSLYDIFEMRRQTANKEYERLREYVIVNLCRVIAVTKMNKILQEAKPYFRSKTRVNKIMIGLTDEVVKDTKKILKLILERNQYVVVSSAPTSQEEQPKDDHADESALIKEDDVQNKQGDELEKGEKETGDDNVNEDTHNPLDQPLDTMPPILTSTLVVDDACLKKVKNELDADDKKNATRDTADIVKDFLVKDKNFFDDPILSRIGNGIGLIFLIMRCLHPC